MIRGPGRSLLVIVGAGVLIAATQAVPAPPRRMALHAALGSVPGEEGAPRSILYLQLSAGDLQLGPDSEGLYLTAEFDGEGEPVEVSRVFRELPAAERGGERFLETGLPVSLSPGSYRGRVRIEDLESGETAETRLEVVVPDFAGAVLAVGGPFFGICNGGRDGEEAVAFVPHPAARYGDTQPGICIELQVVDHVVDPADDRYRVRYEVKDRTGRKVLEQELESPRSRSELRLAPDIRTLGSGAYRLQVEIRIGDEKERVEGGFEVDASRAPFLDEPDKIRAVLGYVATNRELALLDEAPDDSLASVWDRFWRRRDPTPGSDHNEAMAEFIARVNEATRRFGAMEPGWETDMGRIYIRYGEPDRIEEPVGADYRSTTRIWYYETRGQTFVFRDVDGFGRFELAGRRD